MKTRGKKKIKGIALLLVILALCPMLLGAVPSHTNEFFVNDYANVLSEETESYIQENAVSLYRQTTAQICVLTINTLNGEDISEYAVEVFREWGIGDEEKDNGVLILLSVDDREMWVTTGYGIEGTLTDTRLGQFRDEYAIPYYSQNDFDTGTKELFTAILSYVMEEEYGLEGLDGYSVNNIENIDVGYYGGSMGVNLVFFLPAVLLVLSEIYRIYLVFYDRKNGTTRAYVFKMKRRQLLKNILLYLFISGRGRGGRGGGRGGFSGGGFRGGGGSSGGGGAGGSF